MIAKSGRKQYRLKKCINSEQWQLLVRYINLKIITPLQSTGKRYKVWFEHSGLAINYNYWDRCFSLRCGGLCPDDSLCLAGKLVLRVLNNVECLKCGIKAGSFGRFSFTLIAFLCCWGGCVFCYSLSHLLGLLRGRLFACSGESIDYILCNMFASFYPLLVLHSFGEAIPLSKRERRLSECFVRVYVSLRGLGFRKIYITCIRFKYCFYYLPIILVPRISVRSSVRGLLLFCVCFFFSSSNHDSLPCSLLPIFTCYKLIFHYIVSTPAGRLRTIR